MIKVNMPRKYYKIKGYDLNSIDSLEIIESEIIILSDKIKVEVKSGIINV